MCLNTGTLKNINFSFDTNGKLMALGVPILKHFRVFYIDTGSFYYFEEVLYQYVANGTRRFYKEV